MDELASLKYQENGDQEVTSVSRSGRVRKKTSKLMNFDSSEDNSSAAKRQKCRNVEKIVNIFAKTGRSGYRLQENEKNSEPEFWALNKQVDPESESSLPASQSSDRDSENCGRRNKNNILDTASESKDSNYGCFFINKRPFGCERLVSPVKKNSPEANSLYTQKQASREIVIKNGQTKGGSSFQRNNMRFPANKFFQKGRLTAFALWAGEIRQKLVVRYPTMDFGTISKHLRKVWAALSHLEKCYWSRKAKRLVFNPFSKPALRNKFIRKIAGASSSDNFIDKNRNANEEKVSTAKKMKERNAKTSNCFGKVNKSIKMKQIDREVSTHPLDVAGHLALLGESLTVIGELLTNHDGEIAISGSLSILLDSFLCAIGPLICLTQQVPQLNGINPKSLSTTLDNLAYIIPGL